MAGYFSHTSSLTKFIIIIEFILVSYLLYSLTKNVYNSYQIDKYISVFEEENATIESENKQRTEDFLYFTSEQYIDKIAKQNLGLINPGEEVIVISDDVFADEFNNGIDGDNDIATFDGDSNPRQWWNFFFGN